MSQSNNTCAKLLPVLALCALVPTHANAKAGDLDATFDGSGRVAITTVGGITVQSTTAIGLTKDGKIIYAGAKKIAAQGEVPSSVVGRLNKDGSIDTSFNAVGILDLPGTEPDAYLFAPQPRRILSDAQNNIFVVVNSTRPRIFKIKSDGTLDFTSPPPMVRRHKIW